MTIMRHLDAVHKVSINVFSVWARCHLVTPPLEICPHPVAPRPEKLMGFKKMAPAKYPPRQWSLVGYPGSGKSTFAAQLKTPMVVVDADHRFQEVLHVASGEVFELSERRTDNVDPNEITRRLAENMPGSNVKTVVVDSLTAIITPLVVQAMVDADNKRSKNLSASFRVKALAMRQIQDAITRWGTDVLWIYHLQDSRDAQANAITRATISQTEVARLTRSINVQMEVVQDDHGRRGIKVVWARRGRSGMVIWDDTGCWAEMPEKLESAIYDGLTADEQDSIEKETPDYFPNPQVAVSWAIDQGAYSSPEVGRAAYDRIKKEQKPKNAREMAAMWVEYIQQRMLNIIDDEHGDDASSDDAPSSPAATSGDEGEPSDAAEVAASGDEPGDDDCPF